MSKYTTLLFDADNTLLDFFASEKGAIERTCSFFGIPFSIDRAKLYSDINDGYWKRFEKGEIKRDEIKVGRFRDFLAAVGSDADPDTVALRYMEELSLGCELFEGALEMCKALSAEYDLYIVTNGNTYVQKRRYENCGLAPYFSGNFISEETGSRKPEKEFFDIVFKNIPEKDKQRICIIGDSMSSDILGGINAGIDTIFYNPAGAARKYEPTFEVKSYKEILEILL